jgi:hypothetical protein
MMGGTFIIDVEVVDNNFKEIPVLRCLRLWRNSLNNFLLEISLVVLLLLAFTIASSFNHFLGICGYPSFVNQLNILKTLICSLWSFNDASTFISSPSSCTLFGIPVSIDC